VTFTFKMYFAHSGLAKNIWGSILNLNPGIDGDFRKLNVQVT